VDSTAEALALLAGADIDAAIVDVNLRDRDSSPVLQALIDRDLPFVVQTAAQLPAAIARAHPDIAVLQKPIAPCAVVARLFCALDGSADRIEKRLLARAGA